MHPIDWIVRLQPRPPGLRKTGRYLARSTYVGQDVAIEGDYTIYPGFPPSAARRRLAAGNVDELIDGRCTDIATVIPHSRWGDFGQRRWKRFDDRVETRAKVQGTALRQGRFKASYIVSWRETDERDEVWIDDAVPAGSRALGNEPWLWVPDDPKPFTGTLSHKSQSLAGTHQHFFDSATSKLSVAFGDVLFAMVHLDPDDPPRQVMLQWNDGSWEHRAYWGDTNLIGWGVDGAPSCRRMGPLPESGAWIRLEVPATVVNLAGRTLNGIAFTLYDGRATWDYAGKLVVVVPPPQPLDAVFVSQDVPDSAFTGEAFPVSVTMRNNGATTWTKTAGFRLGSQDPDDNKRWGLSRVDLPVASVAPGQTVAFQFTATAGTSIHVGASFQWRMLQEGVGWFGAVTEKVLIRLTKDTGDL